MIAIGERPTPGVNLVGYLEAESGLGEIARKLGRALEYAGTPFAAIPYRRTPSRQEHQLEFEVAGTAPHDLNLICLNADELPAFAHDVGLELFQGRASVGMWFWETDVFRRADRRAFLFLDEVWVPSDYVRRAVERASDIPVVVAPIPIEEPQAPAHTRAELGLPAGFIFLFLFDFVSAERKNPLAVVEAFRTAFAPGEGPTLVLKSINGRERKPHLLAELRAAAAARRDIHVLDGYVTAAERDSFVAACDCYVSLHRSEGYGLTIAEAMSHGKPVIATAYSGSLEFMDESSGHLVPCELVPVPEGWWAYAPGAVWAQPDIEAASSLMRRVFADQQEARELGNRARSQILGRFPVARTATFVASRLHAVRERTSAAQRQLHDHVLRSAAHAGAAVDPRASRSSGWRPSGLLRRISRRMLWPYLDERKQLDLEVVDALARLRRADRSSEG